MTKDELIALACEGKARIDVAYTITRYCIAQDGVDDNARCLDSAIFMSISNEDGGVHEDAAYFTDATDEIDLTDDEAEMLCEAIKNAMARR
jgi:hypothetical protein